jgi:hypothetical protein
MIEVFIFSTIVLVITIASAIITTKKERKRRGLK